MNQDTHGSATLAPPDIARAAPVLLLAMLPFYLNDFANLYVRDWHAWLVMDYLAVKLWPLLLLAWLWRNGRLQPHTLGWTLQRPLAFLATFIAMTLAGTLLDQNGYRLLEKLPGYGPLGGMPTIGNPLVDWIDLTLGLLLVAALEELLFRGAMHSLLARLTRRAWLIVLVSAAAFGLIHWSLGLHAVLVTGAIGAVFMAAYLRTRSVLPLILAHFMVNFIDFAGVIPKSLFKLL